MAVRVFKIGDSGNGDQRHPVIPDATGHALDRARRRKRKQKPIDVQPIEPEESEAVPAETPGYFYEEAVEYEDEFPELETTDSYSTESPADEEEDEVLEEHLESEDMEPDDSLPSELLPSDDIESPNPEVVNRISEESDLHIQGNGLEQPSIEEPITDATAHSDALPGDGLTESPYWQPRAFWLTVSGAIGQAEQGDFDTFRQRLRDEGFSEWEIGRHVELFEQQGADGYLQDPISRESPVAIASAQPRVRQEALEQLKDYGVEGGYDLAAAVAAGVDENTILQAGFSPSHYYDATNFSEQPLSASQVDSFREDLKSAGFSTEDIETRLKLLQSMGAEEYTRVMGELNALGLNSTAGPVTPVEIDNFRDKLQAEGFSDEEIDTRLKLLQSMGAEEYTRVMGELNALGLNSTAGPVTPVEIDNFRDKLQAEGFSDEEIDTRVKLLQSMGAEEYTRVMGKLNALKLPSARVPESAGLEAFSRDLKTLGYLGEYSEAELDERWRVFQSVGRGWDKYLETSVANDPPLELVPELRRIQEETNEAFATAWAMGLGQKKLEFEQLAETYSQRSAGYSPFLEARTKLGLSDISDLEALKESRWKEGRSEGFPDLVTPLLEGRWKDKIVEDKFSGTPEEFEQFQREYETALEGSWQGTMPEVVSYLAKKLEEAELLTPDLVPAIEVALEHAERVNRLEPSFGMTGAGTAILVSSLALPLRFPLFLLKGFAKFGIRPSAKVLERMIGSEGWRDLSGALRLTHDPLTGRAFGPSPLGNLSENAKRVIAAASQLAGRLCRRSCSNLGGRDQKPGLRSVPPGRASSPERQAMGGRPTPSTTRPQSRLGCGKES